MLHDSVVCNTELNIMCDIHTCVQVSARGRCNSHSGAMHPCNVEIKNWYQIEVDISRIVYENNSFLAMYFCIWYNCTELFGSVII